MNEKIVGKKNTHTHKYAYHPLQFFPLKNTREMPLIPKPHSYHLFFLINKRIEEAFFRLHLHSIYLLHLAWVLNIETTTLSALIYFDMARCKKQHEIDVIE